MILGWFRNGGHPQVVAILKWWSVASFTMSGDCWDVSFLEIKARLMVAGRRGQHLMVPTWNFWLHRWRCYAFFFWRDKSPKKGLGEAKHHSFSSITFCLFSGDEFPFTENTKWCYAAASACILVVKLPGRSNMICLLAIENGHGKSWTVFLMVKIIHFPWVVPAFSMSKRGFSITSWSEDFESAVGLCWLHRLCSQPHCLLHRKTQRQANPEPKFPSPFDFPMCSDFPTQLVSAQKMVGKNHPNYQIHPNSVKQISKNGGKISPKIIPMVEIIPIFNLSDLWASQKPATAGFGIWVSMAKCCTPARPIWRWCRSCSDRRVFVWRGPGWTPKNDSKIMSTLD